MPQQRMNQSPYFFRKRMIYCSVNDLIILSLRKKIATGRKRKDSLSASLVKGTPLQVSDRRHKKRESGFLCHRSILDLSTFACFIRLHSNPVFVNVHEWLRLLQLAVQKRSSKVTLRNQELLCFRQHRKRNYTLILYLLPCKAA